MAMRSTVSMIRQNRFMAGYSSSTARYFSDGKGRVLSEEERAAENVYIQKMERDRMEKQKLKAEKEKAVAEKEKAEKLSKHAALFAVAFINPDNAMLLPEKCTANFDPCEMVK